MAGVALHTLIEELAGSAGITSDNAELVKLIASLKHGDPVIVADEISNPLKSNLLTIDSAKHNADLKKYFHKQVLNGIDAEHERIFESHSFDDAVIEEIKKEPSTFKRFAVIANKIKELEEKKSGAKSGDKTGLQKEIDRLNNELSTIKDTHGKALKSEQDKAADTILNYAIQAELGGKSYANEEVEKAINVLTASNLLDKELKSKKIKVIRQDDNTLRLVQTDNPELDYREQNKPVSFGDFVDKILGTHKMLKTSDPTGKGKQPIHIPPSGEVKANESLISALDSNIAALEKTLAN